MRTSKYAIPLGTTMNNKTVYMRIPYFQGGDKSDIMLICGTPGSGKSVIKKLVASYIAKVRPIIMIDPPGRDDYLCYYPNKNPKNLPPKTKAEGIFGWYFYYPIEDARPRKQFEIIRQPNFTKYSFRQYEALGFTHSASQYLKNAIDNYGPFSSAEVFLDFIRNFPTKKNQKTLTKSKHDKPYQKNDTMNATTKESMLNVLSTYFNMGLFRVDKKKDVPYQKLLKTGQNMIFSFHDTKFAKLETAYIFEEIKKYSDKHLKGHKYFIIIDEAHTIFGDKDFLRDQLEEFVLVCRKLGVGLIMVFPEITDALSNKVLPHIKTMIVGKYKGEGAERIKKIIAHEQGYIISNLKFNRYTGDREFAYYTEDYDSLFHINKVYESPCEIHRVGG